MPPRERRRLPAPSPLSTKPATVQTNQGGGSLMRAASRPNVRKAATMIHTPDHGNQDRDANSASIRCRAATVIVADSTSVRHDARATGGQPERAMVRMSASPLPVRADVRCATYGPVLAARCAGAGWLVRHPLARLRQQQRDGGCSERIPGSSPMLGPEPGNAVDAGSLFPVSRLR